MAMARRRRQAERYPDDLREARCKWYRDRRLQPAAGTRAWEEQRPFPGGYSDVTVQLLCEQAQCDCQWCTAFDHEADPRDLWEGA